MFCFVLQFNDFPLFTADFKYIVIQRLDWERDKQDPNINNS